MSRKNFSLLITLCVCVVITGCDIQLSYVPEVDFKSATLENDISKFKATVVTKGFPSTFKDTYDDFDDASYAVIMTIDLDENGISLGDYGMGVACSEEYIAQHSGSVSISEFKQFCSGALFYQHSPIGFLYIPTSLVSADISADGKTISFGFEFVNKSSLVIDNATVSARIDAIEKKITSLSGAYQSEAKKSIDQLRTQIVTITDNFNSLVNKIDTHLSQDRPLAFTLISDYSRDQKFTTYFEPYKKGY